MQILLQSLEKIGLEQYAQAFYNEGFETWEQLLDATETDLEVVGLKIGHRRRLQRAFQDTRGLTGQVPLRHSSATTVTFDRRLSGDSPADEGHSQDSSQPQVPAQTKRKYRRHPKPDANAPERPPSAYVLFSNRIRDRVKGQGLSFTEIAKVVGERWQDPDPEERSSCEREAQELKDIYYKRLAEYKKTPEYMEYSIYLADFKTKHAEPKIRETKRTRHSTEATHTISTISNQPYGEDILSRPRLDTHVRDHHEARSPESSLDTASASESRSWRSDAYSPQSQRYPAGPYGWDSGFTGRSNSTTSPGRPNLSLHSSMPEDRSRSSSSSGTTTAWNRRAHSDSDVVDQVYSGLSPMSRPYEPFYSNRGAPQGHMTGESSRPHYNKLPPSRNLLLPNPMPLLRKPISSTEPPVPILPPLTQTRSPPNRVPNPPFHRADVALPPLREATSLGSPSRGGHSRSRTTGTEER